MICFDEQTLLFSILGSLLILVVVYKLLFNTILNTFTQPPVVFDNTTQPPARLTSQLPQIYVQSESSRLYNPLSPPARKYESSRDYSNDYNVVGFVFNVETNERYALFAKNHDSSRSDRKDYYIIDDKSTRFNIKIPVVTKNYSELVDGDTVFIDTLGKTYTVSIYPIDKYVYNPNI